MVFQNYALYPHMTVYENMSYGLRIRRFDREKINERVQRAAKILELGPFLQRRPRELSGGQRQRVAMGRAIVREPAAFLFDEPLSNLDAKLRVQMRLEIQKLHRELKTTSIFVTHDQVEAMTLADRMIVMHAGVAEQVGRPIQVYDDPNSLFVAGFIGSPAMNFLPGRIRNGAVEMGHGVTLPMPRGARGEEGQSVIFGARPEHLSLTVPGGGLPATVVVVEPTGADTQVFAKFNGAELTAVFRERHDFRAGETIRLEPDHERTHLFDAQSGKSLKQ
jgi:multiple sugar transport system ATP-binding protein